MEILLPDNFAGRRYSGRKWREPTGPAQKLEGYPDHASATSLQKHVCCHCHKPFDNRQGTDCYARKPNDTVWYHVHVACKKAFMET